VHEEEASGACSNDFQFEPQRMIAALRWRVNDMSSSRSEET